MINIIIKIAINKKKEMVKHKYLLVFLWIYLPIAGYSIDRVILSSDVNPMYLPFWPLIARVWRDVIGVKPTLVLIANDDVEVDETIGDVIRFKPIPGLLTSLQAQVIRAFIPIFFPDDICIISDIDMMPLSQEYFQRSVAPYTEDKLVIFRDGVFNGTRYPMCYLVAKGSTFAEIFKISTMNDVRSKIIEWASFNLGWGTDEKMFYKTVNQWNGFKSRCIKLGHKVTKKTIGRGDGGNYSSIYRYDSKLVSQGYYYEAHLLRPYDKYKKEIDTLARLVGIFI